MNGGKQLSRLCEWNAPNVKQIGEVRIICESYFMAYSKHNLAFIYFLSFYIMNTFIIIKLNKVKNRL